MAVYLAVDLIRRRMAVGVSNCVEDRPPLGGGSAAYAFVLCLAHTFLDAVYI